MKVFVAIVVMLLATIGWAATPTAPAAPGALVGEVLEVQDADPYTYLRLRPRTAKRGLPSTGRRSRKAPR